MHTTLPTPVETGSRPRVPGQPNASVYDWVKSVVRLCQPDQVYWCTGSDSERATLTAEAVKRGVLIQLNQEKLPGCYYHRSDPDDVARVEEFTFVCTETRDDAGPTN